jgi:hypothetical protein
MMKHDLETIKDIRNAFAHNPHHLTFKNRAVINRCLGMHHVKRLREHRAYRTNARSHFVTTQVVLDSSRKAQGFGEV